MGFGVWGFGVMCIDVLQYPIHSHSAYLGVGFWGFGALGVWVYVLHDPIHYHSDYLGFLGLGFWGYVRWSPAGTIILRLRRRMILSLGL